jgi:hypothetical protein
LKCGRRIQRARSAGRLRQTWQVKYAHTKAGIPYEPLNTRLSATGIRPEIRRQPTGTFLPQDVPDRVILRPTLLSGTLCP